MILASVACSIMRVKTGFQGKKVVIVPRKKARLDPQISLDLLDKTLPKNRLVAI